MIDSHQILSATKIAEFGSWAVYRAGASLMSTTALAQCSCGHLLLFLLTRRLLCNFRGRITCCRASAPQNDLLPNLALWRAERLLISIYLFRRPTFLSCRSNIGRPATLYGPLCANHASLLRPDTVIIPLRRQTCGYLPSRNHSTPGHCGARPLC